MVLVTAQIVALVLEQGAQVAVAPYLFGVRDSEIG
jgi:hypothetical protein